jgi:hypothetical protein
VFGASFGAPSVTAWREGRGSHRPPRTPSQQLKAMQQTPRWITDAPKPNLRSTTWLETRARLSDLSESQEQFNDFATYYGNLLVLDETRLDDQRCEAERQEMVSQWIPQLLTLAEILDGHIRRYVPEAGEGVAFKTLGEDLTRPADGEQQ